MADKSRLAMVVGAAGLACVAIYVHVVAPQIPLWPLLLAPVVLVCWATSLAGGLATAVAAAALAVVAANGFDPGALWRQGFEWAVTAVGLSAVACVISLSGGGARRWRTMHDRAVESLVAAVDSRYEWNRGRSARVAYYAVAIGRRLGVRGRRERRLYLAALLRDVGMLAVPHEVLNKKGVLSGPERIEVEAHPSLGVHFLALIGYGQEVLDAVHHHHERSDGTGYPSGLIAKRTPLLAKIVAAADAFEALTHDRPQRPAVPASQAVSMLRSEPYSPQVVEALARALEAGEIIVSGPVRGDSAIIRPKRGPAPAVRVP